MAKRVLELFAKLFRDTNGSCTNETAVVGSESKTTRRTFDVFGRLTGVDDTIYAYNADGLLGSVSNDLAIVEYAYTPDCLDAGYTLTLSNGVAFTRSLARDGYRRSLVTGVANAVNGVSVESIAYAYDALNRPTSRNNDTFGYNERGEVVFSRRDTENAEDAYSYDDNGNLLLSTFDFTTNAYTANNLNQYTSIQNISAFSASLREISHDDDGNLTNDCVFSYYYDAANRPKTVSSNGVTLVTNFYDAKSRRVRKVTSEATTTFFYDGWNLIEERIAYTNGTCSAIRYYWGNDLSGSLQGAGGVGGLLYLTIDDLPYVPCYDNNGNIVRYLDVNGNIVAQYIYDALGKTLSQTGSLADFFRHRFSTKYYDSETGLYYYGYRFYSPALMRWLNRDPIMENGGLNLYAFCSNNPVALFDDKGERISIKEDNSIVKDQIATQARAAFFPNASVSFSCSWKGVLSITGTASRRIEILTPGLPQWNQRFRRYDKKWGSKRTAATEWIATYAHEMDHWNAFNSFLVFCIC